MATVSDSKLLVLTAALLLLQSCATSTNQVAQEIAPPVSTERVVEPITGAIFEQAPGISLFTDVKARRVGDIVTVYLVEQTSGQNSSDSTQSQSLSTALSAPTFGGRTRGNMAIDLSSGRNFSGDSDSSQSNQLNGSITVTVREVLPGGNLVVSGEKWIQINQSKEHIGLQGVIRVKDIRPDNSLYSTQVADARITYAGSGINKDMNTMGWAARIVFNSIWPF